MRECNNESCSLNDKDIIVNNVPAINLDSFDKNKMYIIFTMPKCDSCHEVIEYFKNNNIKYYEYDLVTLVRLSSAAYYDVLERCKKAVPVILASVSMMKL